MTQDTTQQRSTDDDLDMSGFYPVEGVSSPGARSDKRTIVDAINNAADTLAAEFDIKLAVEGDVYDDCPSLKTVKHRYPQFRRHALIIAATPWPPPMTPDGKAIFMDGAYYESPFCIDFDTTATAAITAEVLRDEGFYLTWWQPDSRGWCGHELVLHTMLPGHDGVYPTE